MLTKLASDIFEKLAMDPEVRKAFRENIEFRRAWNDLNVQRGWSASADDLHELAVKFGVQKPKPNFNAGPKARTQKPGNPFDAKNFKSHDYDFNAKAKYWDNAQERRKNFQAEADRMKADFEAKFKAQQRQAKANFHNGRQTTQQTPTNAAESFKKFQRAARVGLATAGAAYGGYKLYDYYKNRNKKAA